MTNVYNDIIYPAYKEGKHLFAMLIDPDKCSEERLQSIKKAMGEYVPDLILIGGSLVMCSTSDAVLTCQKYFPKTPTLLFPGDETQLTPIADAVMVLSLISGRNPEYLIGQHVRASVKIKKMGIETIPTGYILIDGGRTTAVQYISNTMPIPRDKTEIAIATALASEQLGHKMIYLEAGSGATDHVPTEMIKAVRQSIDIPLIVGGGLRTAEDIKEVFKAGANIVVVGSAIERNPEIAKELCTQY
ncbi:MAG: geranylgeranylglyceryl/heptaprenylglyceryl phosphate synthase [Bacteroidales bacterium]|nr:geranylgeranylglyceryl/heptaprenylglyceryl phosphate synthase [Bacteroidales bacterium]